MIPDRFIDRYAQVSILAGIVFSYFLGFEFAVSAITVLALPLLLLIERRSGQLAPSYDDRRRYGLFFSGTVLLLIIPSVGMITLWLIKGYDLPHRFIQAIFHTLDGQFPADVVIYLITCIVGLVLLVFLGSTNKLTTASDFAGPADGPVSSLRAIVDPFILIPIAIVLNFSLRFWFAGDVLKENGPVLSVLDLLSTCIVLCLITTKLLLRVTTLTPYVIDSDGDQYDA